MLKAFDCVDHDKLWKALRETGLPDHLTCLQKNLYAGQEATGKAHIEQPTGSGLRKAHGRAARGPPVCLTAQ